MNRPYLTQPAGTKRGTATPADRIPTDDDDATAAADYDAATSYASVHGVAFISTAVWGSWLGSFIWSYA